MTRAIEPALIRFAEGQTTRFLSSGHGQAVWACYYSNSSSRVYAEDEDVWAELGPQRTDAISIKTQTARVNRGMQEVMPIRQRGHQGTMIEILACNR